MVARVAGLMLAALVLAACSGAPGESGKASLWITRDRGSEVVMLRTVDAGQTAMQALESVAEVETRYGGRFVQSIEGIEGSLEAQSDWFWFVNGIEGDRSAAEYRLRPGDVEWWDYRSWAQKMREPVVVGAFPEPFLHGYNGKTRPAWVRYRLPGQRPAAEALARRIDGRATTTAPPGGANVIVVLPSPVVFRATAGGPNEAVLFQVSTRDARALAAEPRRAHFRYEGLG